MYSNWKIDFLFREKNSHNFQENKLYFLSEQKHRLNINFQTKCIQKFNFSIINQIKIIFSLSYSASDKKFFMSWQKNRFSSDKRREEMNF